jgi:hypothetical protein
MTDQSTPTERPIRFEFTDADGDLLSIGVPAEPACGRPSVSFYTVTEPVHVPVDRIPQLIAAVNRAAGITATPVLSEPERAYLRAALSLLADSIGDGVTDEPDGFTAAELAPALASLRKLAGGEA